MHFIDCNMGKEGDMNLEDVERDQLVQLAQQRRPEVYRLTGSEKGQIGNPAAHEVELETAGYFDGGRYRPLPTPALWVRTETTNHIVSRGFMWVRGGRRVNVVRLPEPEIRFAVFARKAHEEGCHDCEGHESAS